MTIGHKTDPDYVVNLWIDQAISVNTDPFDYFVVKFDWNKSVGDVDIQVGFVTSDKSQLSTPYHGVTYNTQAYDHLVGYNVGWSHYASTLTVDKSGTCLAWGGDATSGQGETVFFNAMNLNSYPYPGQRKVATNAANMIPRVVTLECYASWYSSLPSNVNSTYITCQLYLFKGGQMYKGGNSDATPPNNKNFYNKGGVYTNKNDAANYIRNYTSSVKVNGDSYRKFCRIYYDRKTYRAKIEWFDTYTTVGKASKKSGGWGSGSSYGGAGTITSMSGVVQ